jgi:16S rRNA (guanine966-N2)-methyltransferase
VARNATRIANPGNQTMRIIGGLHRSRKLLPPRDDRTTRPITDRVKQSLFDRLWSMGLVTLESEGESAEGGAGGGNVIDLFAGTGSLGLEALSRGSARCLFVEKDRSARDLLQKNLESLDLTAQARIIAMDALAASWLTVVPAEYRPVRVVFVDPPYALTDEPEAYARMAELIAAIAAAPGVMEPGGVAILRTSDHAKVAAVAGWEGPTSHSYGSMVLHFYRAPSC